MQAQELDSYIKAIKNDGSEERLAELFTPNYSSAPEYEVCARTVPCATHSLIQQQKVLAPSPALQHARTRALASARTYTHSLPALPRPASQASCEGLRTEFGRTIGYPPPAMLTVEESTAGAKFHRIGDDYLATYMP